MRLFTCICTSSATASLMLAASAFAGTDCCTAQPSPGCGDAGCEAAVCGFAPDCCSIQWDEFCAELAATKLCTYLCSGICGPGAGDCCANNGTPGCDDTTCCSTICAFDAFCCDVAWDGICAGYTCSLCPDLACSDCVSCGDAAAQDCCCPSAGTPSCNDEACCNAVCANDSFCCEVEWDAVCAGYVQETCPEYYAAVCGAPGYQCSFDSCAPDSGDCCVGNGTPGCDDPDCCLAVCLDDAFCCNVEWDQICANYVPEYCPDLECAPPPACGDAAAGDCCTATGSPNCSDLECCQAVCAFDAFCCDVEWDQVCADYVPTTCPDLECAPPASCAPDAGNCCESNGSPGCDNGECCQTVCAFDAFCCDTEWDQICADYVVVDLLCGADFNCNTPACPADLNGDGEVNGADLGIQLGAWGQSGPGDLDGNGTVDGADLGLLLGAWGACK